LVVPSRLRLSQPFKYTVFDLSTIYAPPLQAVESKEGTSVPHKLISSRAYGAFASETYTVFVV